MPQYNFQCNFCGSFSTKRMSISDFLKTKEDVLNCPECSGGILVQKVGKIISKIDRNAAELREEAAAEVREIINKINKGDERTIRDICGERPNKHKSE